jgi:putative membrane protein
MTLLAQILVGIVAALHFGFLILEMFLWNSPRGRATFGTTREFAAESATLAGNQGLYNGFLAAGLVWSLIAADPVGFPAKVFFLVCVIIAGLYGAATVNKRILVIQAVPAALALAAVLLSR